MNLGATSASLMGGLGGGQNGMSQAIRKIQETFGVDRVLKNHAFTYRNAVEESGNQVLETGITNSYRMDQQKKESPGQQDSVLVANNNILDAWKTGYSSKRRAVVQTYDKSPAEKARERNTTTAARMPTEDLDIMG